MISPQTDVLFFEPSKESNDIIHTTMKLNDIDSGYGVHNIALSDSESTSHLFVASTKSGVPYVYVGDVPAQASGSFREIEIARLDKYLNTFGIERFELVKIDVEGHEFEVLNGFGHFLDQNIIFLIEILSETQSIKLANIFTADRYIYFNIDDENRRIVKSDELSKSLKYNVLVVPRMFEAQLTSEIR
jgi:FkbM family methyltransferase